MISGVEEARRAVRDQIGHGANPIKIYADWRYPTLTADERRVIVEEAHKQRRKVAAHPTTTDGIRNAVAAGVDSVEHCDHLDRATFEAMKKQGTFLVSTVGKILAERNTRILESLKQTMALARDVGVKIASGMDASEARDQGKNAQQLTMLARMGVPATD